MSQTTSFDAFALWKELYNKTETAWADVIQDTLEKKSFAEGLGQIQSQYLQYQEIVNKMTETYLKQVNVPSREEIANVAELIINVDTKIDNLEDRFDEQQETTDKEVDLLKKAVAKLDKKLDSIIELLSTRVEQQQPQPLTTKKPAPTPNKNQNQSN